MADADDKNQQQAAQQAEDDQARQQQNSAGQDNVSSEDLDLIDPSLEDEGKEDAELWDELDQAEAAATDDPADSSAQDDDDSGSDGGSSGDDQGAAAEGQESTSESSAGGADPEGSATAGQSDGKTASSDKAVAQKDIWAEATPEQKAAFEAAETDRKKQEQAARSANGRISALQRQINELTAKQQATPGKQDGAAGKGNQDDDGFLASEDWKGFEKEYPEVAGPLSKAIGALQEKVTRQDKVLSAIGEDRQRTALDEQATLLAEQHPDWETVLLDEQGNGRPEFVDWLNTQPRYVQEAAQRNAEAIVDAEEAADLVGRFKQFRGVQGGGAQSNDTSGQSGQDTGTHRSDGKRKRQLESAASQRSRGPGAATGIPEDGDEKVLWDQWEQQERRQARRA